MSSAHRPTWAAALAGTGLREGSSSAPTQQYSVKDLAAHKNLKQRQPEHVFVAPKDADVEIISESEESVAQVSEDDEDELMRELERIKAERAAEVAKKAADEEAAVLRANPLLNIATKSASSTSAVVKRKWNDETVFKNHAHGSTGNEVKRFINDTTRSDFHRKFLDKYIR